MTHEFVSMVENLPDTFSQDPDKYKAFLDRFGTHYFEMGKFGGVMRMTSDITSTFITKSNSTSVGVDVKVYWVI